MTTHRFRALTLAAALALPLSLSGCFGVSNDKGDNRSSVIMPRTSKVEDANTAGSSKSILPTSEETDPKRDIPANIPPR